MGCFLKDTTKTFHLTKKKPFNSSPTHSTGPQTLIFSQATFLEIYTHERYDKELSTWSYKTFFWNNFFWKCVSQTCILQKRFVAEKVAGKGNGKEAPLNGQIGFWKSPFYWEKQCVFSPQSMRGMFWPKWAGIRCCSHGTCLLFRQAGKILWEAFKLGSTFICFLHDCLLRQELL